MFKFYITLWIYRSATKSSTGIIYNCNYTNASILNYNPRVALSAMETEVTVLKPLVMELVFLMQTIFCMLLELFLTVVMVLLLLLLLVN